MYGFSLKTKESRQQLRDYYINNCQNATVFEYKDADCVIVTYEENGKPYLMIFDGSAGRPSSNYYYRSIEARQAAIEKHLANKRSRLAYKAERKAQNKGTLTGAAATAKVIRQKLKEVFPEVKFSVKSSNFAGGDSVSIHWTDGPVAELVDRIVSQYKQGYFNGMEDIYEYCKLDTERLGCPGAKYIQTSREQSPERIAELEKHCQEKTGKSIKEFLAHINADSWYYENKYPETWKQKYQDMKAANDKEDTEYYARQEEERCKQYEAEEKQRQLDAKVVSFADFHKKKEELEQEKKAVVDMKQRFLNMLPNLSPDSLLKFREVVESGDSKTLEAELLRLMLESSIRSL